MKRFLAVLTVAVASAVSVAGCSGSGAGTPSAGSPAESVQQSLPGERAATKSNTWKLLKAMPTARVAPGAGVVGNKIYVVGGYDNSGPLAINEVYDATKNAWSTGAPMPTPRWLFASAVVGNILYAIGGELGGPMNGYQQTAVVEAYDPAKNTWATKSPMPTARNSMTAVADGNDIYVVGGYNNGSGRLATVERYDPAADSWTEETPMNVARSGVGLGAVGSSLVAADGLANAGNTMDNEGYGVASNSWKTLASGPTNHNSPCAKAMNQLMYVAGGEATAAVTTLEVYNLKKNSWVTRAPMKKAVVAPASVVLNNTLLCFGGASSGNPVGATFYNFVQQYEP